MTENNVRKSFYEKHPVLCDFAISLVAGVILLLPFWQKSLVLLKGYSDTRVYQIDEWNPAGTTPMKTRVIASEHTVGRVELVGKVAPDEVRDKYIGRSAAKLYKRREVGPVKEFRKD